MVPFAYIQAAIYVTPSRAVLLLLCLLLFSHLAISSALIDREKTPPSSGH